MLNHFDEFFEQHVKPRADLELRDLTRSVAEPFPLAPCLWILRTSNVILDNCANRHMYASSEHLASLLAHEDDDVALGALGVLASATRRPPGTRSSNRFRADARIAGRLAALCAGLHDGASKGGDEHKSTERGANNQSVASSATVFGQKVGANDLESGNSCDVHFEFYSEGDGATRLIAEDVRAGSPMATASELVSKHGVPDELKFTLYARVRLAKLAATMRGAAIATQIRLCAFCVLLQSELTAAGGDEQGLQFIRESSPEFVAELLRILRLEGDGGCPPAVVELALRVLAALAGDRAHQGGVITAMRAGGQPQVFAALVNSAVQRLTAAPSPPIGKQVGELAANAGG